MDHAIYTAMGAASQTLNQQAVTASNLANASTPGFRAQLNALRAVPVDGLSLATRTLVTASTPGADMTPGQLDYTSRPLDVALQPGAQSSEQTTLPSGLQIGTGVRPVATERLHSQGNLSQTNNSKDVAIKGQGFFQVMLPDGTSAYTRDGSFQVDQNGQLVTAGGFQVQPAITIPANALSITIGRDGVVSVTQQGQAAPVQVGQLNLTTFMNDTGLESIGENLYIETQSSGAPNESTPGLNGAGLLYQGYVETSNVNVAEELVNMIQVQRAYEINSKAVSTTDQMLQKLTQL